MFGYALAFFGLDLAIHALGGMVGRLLVRDFNDVELAIARESLGVLVNGIAKVTFLHASRRNNVDLHKVIP